MKRRTVRARNRAAAADYRAAALLIEEGRKFCCCWALEAVADAQQAFRLSRIMCDFYEGGLRAGRRLGFWMCEDGESVIGNDDVVQDRRVLALCFMAALAEAGDL